MEKPLIRKIADWACSINYEDIPEDVRSLSRHQTASVLAACFGADTMPATQVYRKTLAAVCQGKYRAAPFFDRASPAAACGITAALSAALDFDDYLFLGHTSHSAVSVPLILGAAHNSDAKETMVAQVVANELGGRLGASVVLGPHNGQLWTFIHAGEAALATSRIMGLDPERTANALALALAAPPYPAFSSLMGPDSKLNLIAEPTMSGVRASLLAKEGVTGPLEILDEQKGFFAGFSFAPAKFFLDGFGKSWVTHSIAIKPYPGCAYVDSMVDSLLDILNEFKKERGRNLSPDEVTGIQVNASLLTTQMEALGKEYEKAGEIPPSFNINFRIPFTAALSIIAGRLTSAQFAPAFLASNKDKILQLASKVSLSHDWDMTLEILRGLARGLEPFSILNHLSLKEIRKAIKEARQKKSHEISLGASDIFALLRVIKFEDLKNLRNKMTLTGTMAQVDFNKLQMPFAANVTLKTTDGKSYESGREFPDGAPGGKSREDVTREKFLQEASPRLGPELAQDAMQVIFSDANPTKIMDALKQPA